MLRCVTEGISSMECGFCVFRFVCVRELCPLCIGGVCAACGAESLIFKTFLVPIAMVSNLCVFAVDVRVQSPILSPFVVSCGLEVLEKSQSDLEISIVDAKQGIASTKAEIEALDGGVKALDKSVAEATEQRKEENEDYTALRRNSLNLQRMD